MTDPEQQPLCGATKTDLFAGEQIRLPVKGAAAELRAEADENVCRKELSPVEMVALGERLEPLAKAEAEERMLTGKPSSNLDKGRSDDQVAAVRVVSEP